LAVITAGIAIPLPIVGKNDRDKIFVEKMCAINFELFQIYASLVAFFLPLVMMFIMYTLTIRTLRRQARLVSRLLVHNGKNSPPNSGRSLSFGRKNSSHLPSGVFHKATRSDHHFQRRESALSIQDTESSRTGLISLMHRRRRRKYPCDEDCTNDSENQEETKACNFPPFNTILKTLRRIKFFLCFESLKKSNMNERLVANSKLSRR